MPQDLPLHRTSLASLDDDQFVSAHSSQPPSRLVSVFAAREQLTEDINMSARPSQPLVSECLLPEKTASPSTDGQAPMPSALSDPAEHSPKNQPSMTSVRMDSSQADAHDLPVSLDATLYDEILSITSSNSTEDKPVPSPNPANIAGHGSSAIGREQGFPAYHHQDSFPFTTWEEPNIDVSKREMTDEILCTVHGYLSARQHEYSSRRQILAAAIENKMQQPPFQTELEEPYLSFPTSSDDRYLVTPDDVAAMVDIAPPPLQIQLPPFAPLGLTSVGRRG
ncbi:hypothetical protein F4802DRAFT_618531 [Xylaria palmicola]|nr:hypothetical protein F4802DRAFT_618531 [Xylaria palmicola]